jgi:hypothetical protein
MARLGWPRVALVLVLAAAFLTPASAAVRLGTISVGAGYGYFSGPGYGWGGWYPPPFYAGWWGYPYAYPFYEPFYGPSLYWVAQPNLGEVKLQNSAKDAEVYLDNAYAGTASKLKSFWLQPGVYELELRAQGRSPQSKRIYVLTGKTLKVNME